MAVYRSDPSVSIIWQPVCPRASQGAALSRRKRGGDTSLAGPRCPNHPPPARQPVDLASIGCGSRIAQSRGMIRYSGTPRPGARRGPERIVGGRTMRGKRQRVETTAETEPTLDDREEPVGLMRDVVAHTETSP